MQTNQTILVAPIQLNSLDEIAKTFGRSKEIVKEWHKDGAPIVKEGAGGKTRYSAELNQLQAWRVASQN